jgi:D-sedoheptulose 7-phosphate isomerase
VTDGIQQHRTDSAVDGAGIERQVDEHVRAAQAIPALIPAVRAVGELLCDRFAAGGTLYTFGNGGSAADAQHFTGELIGHYKRDRRPLAAVTLTTDPTVATCIANDYSYDDVFARQVSALVKPGDVVAAFTTSVRSANIVAGLATARKHGAVNGPTEPSSADPNHKRHASADDSSYLLDEALAFLASEVRGLAGATQW